jgi:hypothetical protein
MKKQTAVEWLMEQITYDNGYGQRWISFTEDTELNVYFEDAKAMETEQICDAYTEGKLDGYNYNSEEYYKETYEK